MYGSVCASKRIAEDFFFFYTKMPRIDPQKLLTCIGVLLSPNGGIRSSGEVKRLSSLMAKYSKKLVSKCIYIQILKCTETELLGQFMGVGGWMLAHNWLTDGVETKNWPLVQELLELLLLCPVDVPRLQSNSAPKLVKSLSREGDEGVRILATRLVEQWLKIAKGETMTIASQNSNIVNKENLLTSHIPIISKKTTIFNDQSLDNSNDQNSVDSSLSMSEINDKIDSVNDDVSSDKESNEGLVFKITLKDGKQTLAKVNEASPKKGIDRRTSYTSKGSESEDRRSSVDKKSKADKSLNKSSESRHKDSKDRDREKSKDRSSDKNKKSSYSSSNKSSSSSGKTSSSSKHSSSSSKLSSSSSGGGSSSKSSKSSINKSLDGKTNSSSSSNGREKDKHRSSSASSSSKSAPSSSKEKDKRDEKDVKNKSSSDASKLAQAEKDKATLAKVLPQPLNKIGRIPKKTTGNDAEKAALDSAATDKDAETQGAQSIKKKSISIEVRKDSDNRPKTVKTYNSQFRSHGLGEEAPPPPSRRDLKKPTASPTPGLAIVTNSISKRPLSPASTAKESDKKIKIATSPTTEKPGAIKLIPPKPKPSVLVESDMFMDAISAATNKKEVRKRKRAITKESECNEKSTPSTKDGANAVTSAPLKFYQDTLDDSEIKNEKFKLDAMKSEGDGDDTELKEKKMKRDPSEHSDDDAASGDKTIDKKDDNNQEDEPMEEVKREPGPGCGPDGPPGVLTIHRRKGPKKSLRWRPQEALEEIRYFELDENERVNVTKTFVDMKQMERSSERDAFLIGRKIGTEDQMLEQTPWAPLIIVDDVPDHPNGVGSKEKDIQAERERTCLKTIYFNRSMIPDSPHEPDVITYQNVEPQIMPLFDVTGNPDAVHDFTNMPWPEPKGSPPHKAANLDDLSGNSNFGQFNQFNAMNWPQGQPQNAMNIRSQQPMGAFGQMMPADTMSMNPMQRFHGPNMGPPLMGPPPFGPNNVGFINNFGPPRQPIINDNRGGGGGVGRNNASNNWFGNNNNGGNNNWQPQKGGPNNNNNNSNQRSNWTGNRRICKQFQRGYCRHGDSCKFLHPGVNCPPF